MEEIKEKLLLVGAGGLGRIVSEHARVKYDCYFLDDGQIGNNICGIDVIGKLSDIPESSDEFRFLLVTIGNNKLREELYEQAAAYGYDFPNIIVDSAYISPFAEIGKGCIILNNAVIQNGAKIGNGVIINAGVEIHQDSTVGNNSLIYANSVTRSYSVIGDRVTIGSTVTIGNYVEVPDDSIIESSILS